MTSPHPPSLPVPIVNVSSIRPLLHNPSWVTLAPLGHSGGHKGVSRGSGEVKANTRWLLLRSLKYEVKEAAEGWNMSFWWWLKSRGSYWEVKPMPDLYISVRIGGQGVRAATTPSTSDGLRHTVNVYRSTPRSGTSRRRFQKLKDYKCKQKCNLLRIVDD